MGKSSGGGSSADVVGGARETGEQARRLNEAQTAANRPNQSNAWGSTEWSSTPKWDQTTGQYINQWEQTETLNPKLQGALDAQQNVQLGRSNLAQGQMARVWDDQSQAMDFDQYGEPIAFDYDLGDARTRAEDAAYQKSTSRLDPQFESERAGLETRLRNQGLMQGDAAYDNAMSNYGTNRNDAYEQARLSSIGEGAAESDRNFGQAAEQNRIANALRDQGIDEGLFKRGFSLEEMNKMLAGQQISGGPPTTGGSTETISSKNLGGG